MGSDHRLVVGEISAEQEIPVIGKITAINLHCAIDQQCSTVLDGQNASFTDKSLPTQGRTNHA